MLLVLSIRQYHLQIKKTGGGYRFHFFYDITSIEHFVEVVKRKILVYVDFMERKESQGNIMDEICEYIDQNFTEKLVLSDIAEKFS